jgi:hypothetical protein
VVPEPWRVVRDYAAVQLVEPPVAGSTDPEAVALGPNDASDMLELVGETDPGPFLERTIELGRYPGIRRDGALVAMAGERFHFDGWREISGVCTSPSYRGQGTASSHLGYLSHVPLLYLVLAVVGVPLAATAARWLLAGREPPAIARTVIQ